MGHRYMQPQNPERTIKGRLLRVIVESPFAGDIERNQSYARLCLRDCFNRGEAPFASHLLYTQPLVLDDGDPAQRSLGIAAGFVWAAVADKTVVYSDLGISPGMEQGIAAAMNVGRPIEHRSLPPDLMDAFDAAAAKRRLAEIKADPSKLISLDELKERLA